MFPCVFKTARESTIIHGSETNQIVFRSLINKTKIPPSRSLFFAVAAYRLSLLPRGPRRETECDVTR